jgi:hypothetical protein
MMSFCVNDNKLPGFNIRGFSIYNYCSFDFIASYADSSPRNQLFKC